MSRTVATAILLAGCLLFSADGMAEEPPRDSANLLWYRAAAEKWTEAAPLGNGRLGAMLFGRVVDESIPLNEDTLYAGEPSPPGAVPIHQHVDETYDLVRQQRYREADRLVQSTMTGRVHQSYTTLGSLDLHFHHEGPPADYRRQLDLGQAIAGVSYRIGETRYTREAFVSAADQVVVIRLECDRPGGLSLDATLRTPHHFARLTPDGARTVVLGAKLPLYASIRSIGRIRQLGDQRKYPELFQPGGLLRADVVRHDDNVFYAADASGPGMTFQARLAAVADGGRVTTGEDGLSIRDADAVTLLVAAGSSFAGYDRSPSRQGVAPEAACRRQLEAAAAKPYARLREDHVSDYRALFDRVALDLGPSPATELPTDERIRAAVGTFDPQLAALHFQFGRYLLISSSRPGGQPANLQGLWADTIVCPWNGGFHLDVNLAMNYWPAQSTGLAPCAEPLVDYIERLAANGRITAQRGYRLPGWVAHIATSIWCNTDPIDSTPMTAWNMGGAWLCQNLWDHYAYALDREFLRGRAYPLLRDATLFYLGWLREDEAGRLVTPVSLSPENRFHYDGGKPAAVSMASTMDMAILRDLFAHTLHAAEVLRVDPELQSRIRATLPRLFPYQVGRHGQLQEWYRDWDRPDDRHRHTSHLWSVFPATQIDPRQTPPLAAAAVRSLAMRSGLDLDHPMDVPRNVRTDGELGFDRAWSIHLWNRLGYPELAGRAVRHVLADGVNPNLMNQCYAGKPLPFEIEGNLGYTSGIATLLLDSRLELVDGQEVGQIDLLPSLPPGWPDGSVQGLHARGGFVVNFRWAGGRLIEAEIRSTAGAVCRVRYPSPLEIVSNGNPVETSTVAAGVVQFATRRGDVYLVRPLQQPARKR